MTAKPLTPHRIVIVGGGFAGVRAATLLAKAKPANTTVTLISDRGHFEYYATLYRIVAGYAMEEVRVPLQPLFRDTCVALITDRITAVDPKAKTVKGKKSYPYDTLVLALGSETTYFGIPGMESAFGMKDIAQAQELRAHIRTTFAAAKGTKAAQDAAGHIVIIGGGATGVELAGELSHYAPAVARDVGFDRTRIRITLLEALPRILPLVPEDMSAKTKRRLEALGVRVQLNCAVQRKEEGTVVLKDNKIQSATVVWTAGVKANGLYAQIPGAETDKKGRVVVDEFLRAKNLPDIMVIGDGAATQYSGMAQTAVFDGTLAAHNILRLLRKQPLKANVPQKPAFAIPAGPHWAAVLYGPIKAYGILGWAMRRAADMRAFLTLMPLGQALKTFFGRK